MNAGQVAARARKNRARRIERETRRQLTLIHRAINRAVRLGELDVTVNLECTTETREAVARRFKSLEFEVTVQGDWMGFFIIIGWPA
jgi:hypothetical protein